MLLVSLATKEMGAPVYNTNFVGSGTRTPKRTLDYKQGGMNAVYSRYKSIEGDAKKVAEMGTGMYGAYKMGRAAYPYIRAGLAAL